MRCLLLAIACCLTATAAWAQLAVRGETVYTMAGEPVQDGVVLVREGRIESVGPASTVQIPSGYTTLQARVVTPGLIDAHTVVGLAGYLNQIQDQDQIERSDAVQPELRAIDAYNPLERLVSYIRNFGVTTIHTGHAPGALISGQTMIVKTVGGTVDEAVVMPIAMVAATLGAEARAPEGKSPGSRSKAVAMLRSELIKAQEYAWQRENSGEGDGPARDLKSEVLVRVLERELPLLVTVELAQDILTALRLADEFGFRLVLDSAAESYLVLDEIRAAGIEVILHAPMLRHAGEAENASFETPAKLREAGIRFALQSGYESYVPKTRVVLFEAAIAAANGLAPEDALASVTIDAARILAVDGRLGSLEPGKDADLALFDGDPFEYTTHCVGVVINGQPVSEGERLNLEDN